MYPKQLFVLAVVLHLGLAYRMYTLGNLCPTNFLKIGFDFITDNRPEVQLQADDRSGAFVPFSWNASTLKKYEACEFKVEANKYGRNRGVYASVQRMNLRRRPRGDCIDFVQFKHDNGIASPRLCGQYNATDDYTEDLSKFFDDDSGRIRVHIVLDTSQPIGRGEPDLMVQLYMTAYVKDCNTPHVNEILCSPGRCISKEFENDEIVNCPPNQCSDEDKCVQQIPVRLMPEVSGKNILVSALTSLVLTMVAVLCIYMCCKYKYGRDGASSTNAGGGTTGNRRNLTGQRVEEPEFQNIAQATTSDPSAQPIRPSAPEADHKDLPPSYESLFIKNDTPAAH